MGTYKVFTVGNDSGTMKELMKKISPPSLCIGTVKKRLSMGWGLLEALTKKPGGAHRNTTLYPFGNEMLGVTEIAGRLDMNPSSVRARVLKGEDLSTFKQSDKRNYPNNLGARKTNWDNIPKELSSLEYTLNNMLKSGLSDSEIIKRLAA